MAKNIKIISQANLPTRFGAFKVLAVIDNKDGHEHAVFMHGDISGARGVVCRIHSECLTGDTIFSQKCDCGDQLKTSLRRIGRAKKGVLIYLRQEGRGIGFVNKIKAYELQDKKGLDTVEANIALGLKKDARDYRVAVKILKHFKVRSIKILTNNPEKINQLKRAGIKIEKRIPILPKKTKYNTKYLEIKKQKLNHML